MEALTITYLDNIKIGFTNGHPEFDDVVPIEELDSLLKKYIDARHVEEARNRIIFEYEQVLSSENGEITFLKKIRKEDFDGNDASYYTKLQGLEDSYRVGGDMTLKVAGVIQNVEKYTLRTDSLIADCVLGQGAALDWLRRALWGCFSAKTQNADTDRAILENEKLRIALEILENITDPIAKAEAFAKMFNPPKSV